MATFRFRDAQAAFEDAIKAGVLSADPKSATYAGQFMYMCTEPRVAGGELDAFKHRDTREYTYVPVKGA